MAPLRVPIKISGQRGSESGFTDSVSSCPPESDCSLFKSAKAGRTAGSSSTAPGKALCGRDGTRRKRVLLPCVSGAEKVRRLETGDRSQYAESVTGEGNVCYGHLNEDQRDCTRRNVGDVVGPFRRVSSHSDAPSLSGLSLLSGRQSEVPVFSSAVRPDVFTLGIYTGYEANKEMGVSQEHDSVSVSRRLVESGHALPSTTNFYGRPLMSVPGIGFVGKPREVRVGAEAGHSFSRRTVRFHEGDSIHDSIAHGPRSRFDYDSSGTARTPFVSSGESSRTSGSYLPYGTARSSAFKVVSDVSDRSATVRKSEGSLDQFGQLNIAPSPMVDFGRCDESRSSFSGSGAGYHDFHGRFSGRMGCSVSESGFQWQMAPRHPTHQLAGAADSVDGMSITSVSDPRTCSIGVDRQCVRGSLHQQTGRDAVQISTQAGVSDLGVSAVAGRLFDSTPYHGSTQRVGGFSFTAGSGHPGRVEAVHTGISLADNSFSLGFSRGGIVREQSESASGQVCLAVPGRPGLGGRRDDVSIPIGHASVCISSELPSSTVSAETTASATVSSTAGSTMVASGTVGSAVEQFPTPTTADVSVLSGDASATSLGSSAFGDVPSQSHASLFGEQRLLGLGYSQRVVDRLMLSHSIQTQKNYKSKWVLFVDWASKKDPPCDPTHPSVALMSEFMEWLFRVRKIQASSINNYRSAVAFFWKRVCDYSLPTDAPVFKDLMRSFKRERPKPPKTVVPWNLQLVLEFFSSSKFSDWGAVTNKELTLKTVFLLALASGKRRSELHAFTVADTKLVHGQSPGAMLTPDSAFVSKTQIKTGGLGALRPVFIPSLPTEENEAPSVLCPVESLRQYVSRSNQYRSDQQKKLIISWVPGTLKDISPQTVSSYIKRAIILAYVEAAPELLQSLKIKPHSVRHVATSLLALQHFTIDDVLRTGSWVSPNVFISNYLQNYSTDMLTGLHSVGHFVAGGSVH